jgi:hypothetical protein
MFILHFIFSCLNFFVIDVQFFLFLVMKKNPQSTRSIETIEMNVIVLIAKTAFAPQRTIGNQIVRFSFGCDKINLFIVSLDNIAPTINCVQGG